MGGGVHLPCVNSGCKGLEWNTEPLVENTDVLSLSSLRVTETSSHLWYQLNTSASCVPVIQITETLRPRLLSFFVPRELSVADIYASCVMFQQPSVLPEHKCSPTPKIGWENENVDGFSLALLMFQDTDWRRMSRETFRPVARTQLPDTDWSAPKVSEGAVSLVFPSSCC